MAAADCRTELAPALALLLSGQPFVRKCLLLRSLCCLGGSCVYAMSRDTARAANQPKCTAMGFGRDNARHCYQRAGYVNANRGRESKQCDMCTETSSPLRAVVPAVRLLSEVVLHDVGANRGRTFQTTLPAW